MSIGDLIPTDLLNIIKGYATFDYIHYKMFCNTCLWVKKWIPENEKICCPNNIDHIVEHIYKIECVKSNNKIIIMKKGIYGETIFIRKDLF